MYIYESCIGNIYCLNENQDIENLYCDMCGDYDDCLGYFENVKDFLINFADNIHTNKKSNGYDFDYIYNCIISNFDDVISKEECMQIIEENQSYSDEDMEE